MASRLIGKMYKDLSILRSIIGLAPPVSDV